MKGSGAYDRYIPPFDRIKMPLSQPPVRLAFRTLTIHSRTAILDFVSAGVAQW